MDMTKRSVKSKGIGCFTVVGIIFIVLKLLEIQPVASWSWLWVLSPFWIALAVDIVLVLLGIFLIWLSHRRW
jgi:membrane protein YdbS with pleckstrin-like domain